MRKQFVETVKSIMATDQRVVVILGDIGEYSFRDVFHAYPNRIYNVGVNEQAMISMASGLAKEGLIPIVHTISPFLIERAYEQIKIDIGYQRRKVILVGCGGSYDYAAYGATHHSPADVALMYNVPGIQICIPGHPIELDIMLKEAVEDNEAYYIRLGEEKNRNPNRNYDIFWKSDLKQCDHLIICVGNILNKACYPWSDVLYINKLTPFDKNLFSGFSCPKNRIVIVEPYYPVLCNEVIKAIDHPVRILNIGVPRQFIHQYGKISDIDQVTGLSVAGIRKQIEEFLNGNNS
jgi:transketolase